MVVVNDPCIGSLACDKNYHNDRGQVRSLWHHLPILAKDTKSILHPRENGRDQCHP